MEHNSYLTSINRKIKNPIKTITLGLNPAYPRIIKTATVPAILKITTIISMNCFIARILRPIGELNPSRT